MNNTLLELSTEQIIPQGIIDVENYLKDYRYEMLSSFQDGRIDSAVNEAKILSIIAQRFTIDIPRAREWYDFLLEDNGEVYPINIKITDTNHADNLSCKLGIYYALTGKAPDMPNEVGWLTYFERLRTNLGYIKDKNYYFLIINKTNHLDVFSNALKNLSTLVSNGNNLPFQCKWNTNRVPINRTFEESVSFILKSFSESIKLRSEIYFNFKKYFAEYV
jgi:hypothetical protein